jgi:hypothetical protein
MVNPVLVAMIGPIAQTLPSATETYRLDRGERPARPSSGRSTRRPR